MYAGKEVLVTRCTLQCSRCTGASRTIRRAARRVREHIAISGADVHSLARGPRAVRSADDAAGALARPLGERTLVLHAEFTKTQSREQQHMQQRSTSCVPLAPLTSCRRALSVVVCTASSDVWYVSYCGSGCGAAPSSAACGVCCIAFDGGDAAFKWFVDVDQPSLFSAPRPPIGVNVRRPPFGSNDTKQSSHTRIGPPGRRTLFCAASTAARRTTVSCGQNRATAQEQSPALACRNDLRAGRADDVSAHTRAPRRVRP